MTEKEKSEFEENGQERLVDLMGDFSTLMMVTWSTQGEISVRPMSVARRDGDVFWFPTATHTEKVHDVLEEHEVILIGQNEKSTYVAARGSATVRADRETINRLWSEAMRVWFPGGREDSELAFIRVQVIEGEFWDVGGTKKLRYMFQAFKAYFEGTTPALGHDMHGKV